MSSIGNDNSKRGFERMEEKVLQFEAEAETTEDLSKENRSLDDELAELDSDVDDELAALKKKQWEKRINNGEGLVVWANLFFCLSYSVLVGKKI